MTRTRTRRYANRYDTEELALCILAAAAVIGLATFAVFYFMAIGNLIG